ncbi:MAG: CHAP domain-containing protein [Nitrospira sp. CR1.1]|nr:CHAP domain-containing protein [Nitrospira sp. CR1.1]
MHSRRSFIRLAVTLPFLLRAPSLGRAADDAQDTLDELQYPSFDLINESRPFGTHAPDKEQYKRAKAIWEGAPKGKAPYDIANYFLSFEKTDAEVITQWPQAASWNPLIVEFFSATNYRAENDLTPWCAAFVNWCLKRSGRQTSGSPKSQSFLNENFFEQTKIPKIGDLAVFTCYEINTTKSVGLGHVAFLAKLPNPTDTQIVCLGGNQTKEKNSRICQTPYALDAVRTKRTINKKRVPVDIKFNTYIRIV